MLANSRHQGDERIKNKFQIEDSAGILAEIPGVKSSETVISPPNSVKVKDATEWCHNLVRESLGFMVFIFNAPNVGLVCSTGLMHHDHEISKKDQRKRRRPHLD
jgi:hypothetical protein